MIVIAVGVLVLGGCATRTVSLSQGDTNDNENTNSIPSVFEIYSSEANGYDANINTAHNLKRTRGEIQIDIAEEIKNTSQIKYHSNEYQFSMEYYSGLKLNDFKGLYSSRGLLLEPCYMLFHIARDEFNMVACVSELTPEGVEEIISNWDKDSLPVLGKQELTVDGAQITKLIKTPPRYQEKGYERTYYFFKSKTGNVTIVFDVLNHPAYVFHEDMINSIKFD